MGDQKTPGRIGLVSSIPGALRRARIPILSIALTYFFSVVTGAVLVHSGNNFSVNTRDKLVARALASDPSSIALKKGENLKASLWDFSRNLVLGAVPSTLGGLGVVFPYPFVAFRGWVGGIVSIDSRHKSRLTDPKEAFYYILTLILQLIPYSLAGGAGVALGLSYYRPKPFYLGKKWFGLSREAVLDVVRIYLVVIPLFLIASLWEFLAR